MNYIIPFKWNINFKVFIIPIDKIMFLIFRKMKQYLWILLLDKTIIRLGYFLNTQIKEIR